MTDAVQQPPGEAGGAGVPNEPRLSRLRRRYGHLWFVLPGLIFFALFLVYPTVSAVGLSLTDWRGLSATMNFVGLDNFAEALVSTVFHNAALNTFKFFVVILIFQHTVGLFLAVQLNARPRFVQLYRTVLFLPVVLSLVATGFIWTLLLSPHIGLINPALDAVGLGAFTRAWMSDTTWALPTVIVVQAWNLMGWAIVIYLAGLQNVPRDLEEAAEIDGASGWQSFRRITFPLLSPAFTAVTVLTFIQIFRVFDVVYVLAGPLGSPAGRTDVLGTLIYRTAFGAMMSANDARLSYAITLALIVFIFMAIVAFILIRFLRRREVQI